MSIFLKTLYHVNNKDFKKTRQRVLDEQKVLFEEKRRKEIQEKKERKELTELSEIFKFNWRKELNEQMTTSDVFFTSLPSTGDVNLAYPSWNIQAGEGYSVSDGTVTINGSGGGLFGNGVAASFDTSIYTTLVFDVNIIGDEILGVFGNSPSPILVALSSGTYSVSLENILLFVAPLNGSVQINNLRYQRRTPMNVFVPLDNPEASSFIRLGPNLSDLSPEERNAKLREMLNASDEYVEKILGSGFPGTGSVPPGEYDPFVQAPAGEAGDTPGVEVTNFDTSKMGVNYGDTANQYMPRGGDYGPSLKPDGTSGFPKPWEMNKGNNGQWYEFVPGSGWSPIPSAGSGVKQAQSRQDTQVASYQPQGELISERKKLKSPEKVLNKIPGYYTGKPAPLGFPVEQPPKMVNGMHPDLVDGKAISQRFNRMDPQSAQAMPKTGNPYIDKTVEKAKKQSK